MQKFFSKLNKPLLLKIFLSLIILIFLIFIVFILWLKYFISYNSIEKNLEKLTNLNIEFIEPQTDFDYRFNLNLKAKNINIYSKDKSKKFASLNDTHIALKPIGLLFKKAYIKNFDSKNIEIALCRNEKGEIDIQKEINTDFIENLQKKHFLLTKLNSKIDNFNFTFNDNYKIKNQINLNLKDGYVKISKKDKIFLFKQQGLITTNILNDTQSASLDILINSKYPFNHINTKDIRAKMNIDNVNLFIFNDLAKKYISNDINMLSGNLDLKLDVENDDNKISSNIQNLSLKLNDGKIITPYKKDIDMNMDFDIDKDKIEINDLKILSNDLDVSSKGQITKYLSKNPYFDINSKITKTQINNFTYLIPDNAIFYRKKGIPTLKKANFFATADGTVNLKYSPLDMEGNLKISNIYIPNYPKPYSQNDVNLTFMHNKMRVYTRVYTPKNEYVLIDGISNLDDSLWGKYLVKSTSKIDLAFARLYLVPIQQIIGFNIGPVPIMDIKGYGKIDIKTQGTINDAQIFGFFEATDAQARLEGLDGILKNGSCKITFDDRKIIFNFLKGKLNDADFNLKGNVTTKGEADLDILINGAKTSDILKIFNNSEITKPYINLTKNIKSASGLMELELKLSGLINDYENKEFLNNLSPLGRMILKDNKIVLNNNIDLNKISAIFNFGPVQKFEGTINLNESKFNVLLNSKTPLNKISKGEDFLVDCEIKSSKINSNDILQKLKQADFSSQLQKRILDELQNYNFYSKLNLKSQGKISLNDLNIKNFKNQGYLIGLNSAQTSKVNFLDGIIKFENDKVTFNNFKFKLDSMGLVNIKGSLNNVLSLKPLGDLNIYLEKIMLDDVKKIFPKINIENCLVNNGSIIFKGDDIKLNSISLNYDSMPLFLNVKAKDIYDKKDFEADFSTIVNETSSDNIINPYLTTPLKIKGELPLKGSFSGNSEDYAIDFSATIPKNSDISFMGANISDTNYKRELQGNIEVKGNVASIKNIKLIKFITNQNKKTYPIICLKIMGNIIQRQSEFFYDNLKISTNSMINVRILNLIFKKSILKQGNFDCNISLNGNVKIPKIIGKIDLYDLDIPLYNTQINNIKVAISNNFIDSEILAKNNSQSDIKINLHAKNKLDIPYVINDIKISSNKIIVQDILKSIEKQESKTDIEKRQEIVIKPNDLIIHKGAYNFKDVEYEKIRAQNLLGDFSYKNGIIDLNDAQLNIAKGKINAKGKYNIKSSKLELDADMKDCDSNILAETFLNLKNQIHGKIDGKITLSTKGLSYVESIKNIKSNITFTINDGKMPKLGSLEYFLRAGNLIKNGILGLSINNVIEVLTPYKTGEFEQIQGNLVLEKGAIKDLDIFSKGKNLSLFLDGNYLILDNLADIEIYGKLSQNISNALGALGNASINQFIEIITTQKKNKNQQDEILKQYLDKIPPIEGDNENARYFKVKVHGDINKENFIRSFNWL